MKRTPAGRDRAGMSVMRVIVVVCLILCLWGCPVRAGAGPVLVYGANMPEISEQQGGLPRLAGLVGRERERGDAFFLFGGDSLGPSMLGSLDRGAHVIDLLNLLEPDAWGVGKREFIFREDELSLRAAEAFFPLVLTNAEDPETGDGILPGLERGVLARRGGLTLGILARVGEQLMVSYPPQRLRLLDADASVRAAADDLRERGADLVVLLVDFRFPGAVACLEEGVVDVVLGNSGEKAGVVPTGRGLFAQVDEEGSDALVLQLPTAADLAAGNGAASITARVVPLADEAPDPAVEQRADYYLTHLDKILSIEIGSTTTAFDTERASVRSGENAFGNFVADTLRSALGADVALINGGVIRGGHRYEAGDKLLRRDIRSELPFYDEAALIEVSGAQLRAALENGFSRIEDLNGRFPHVSGMEVVYRPAAPAGSRVESVRVGGRPLNPDATYTLATSKYLATGGDDYRSLQAARALPAPAALLGDLVRQRVAEMGAIAPVVDGRLKAAR